MREPTCQNSSWFIHFVHSSIKYFIWMKNSTARKKRSKHSSPVVQVRCMILDAWSSCTGTTQRDGMGREEGGGFRMRNTCIPVADSFWYMAKPIQYCKVKKEKRKKENIRVGKKKKPNTQSSLTLIHSKVSLNNGTLRYFVEGHGYLCFFWQAIVHKSSFLIHIFYMFTTYHLSKYLITSLLR